LGQIKLNSCGTICSVLLAMVSVFIKHNNSKCLHVIKRKFFGLNVELGNNSWAKMKKQGNPIKMMGID